MEIYEYDLYTAGDEGQDSRPTLDDMKHQSFPMDRAHKSDSLSEEDIYTSGYERPQPTASLDTAKFIMKADWREPFPDRWRATLQKALQSYLSRLEASVLSLKLMDDPSCAEVQITPSTALEVLKKHTPISLRFRDKEGKSKEVTAQICLDEDRSVTVAQKSRLKENGAPSSKVISSMPVTAASEDTNNIEDVSASDRAPNEETSKTAEMTPETPVVMSVPFYLSWYMHHTYGKEIKQIEQQHGVSFCAEVSVSVKPEKSSRSDSVSKASEDFQKLVQGCVNSFSDAVINHNHMHSDIVKQALHHIQSEDSRMMFTMSASNGLFFGPKKFTDIIKREVEDTRMESQFNDSRQTMNDMKHPKITMDRKSDSQPLLNDMKHEHFTMDRLHSQPEVIGTASDKRSQPLQPLDTATFIMKVDWREPFPDRWRATLQKALQSCLSKLKASLLSLKLMDDPSCAEVQITPSTALEVLKKHTPISLRFRDKEGKSKEVTAQICLDEDRSVTVAQKSRLKENGAPSSKVIGSLPVTEDTNNVEDVSASDRAPNEETSKTAEMTPETPVVMSVPFYLSWYMHHTYGKEIKQIEQQHGVSFCAEVSVSVKPAESSRSDSVSKASEDFQKLVQGCVNSFSDAVINHNHMHLDIVKEALHHIQSEDSRMMFTMSARNGLFFGLKKFTDKIKREVEDTRMESQFNDKSSQMKKDNFSPQSRSSLYMDTKELPTQLEMDTVLWDLMKLSYKEQLSQLETKYGVSFHEDKQQNNGTIKVQARSKGVQHVNLESHAIRALTQLYQKLASAAVTCELKNPTDATLVASTVEKLRQQHHRVVAGDVLSRWRLVGLPEHLGPAIAVIEKILKRSVFDDKKKKLIGYSGYVPHARGLKWHQV